MKQVSFFVLINNKITIPMPLKKKTVEAIEKTKQMSPEERAKLDKIMTEFIIKYRKYSTNTLMRRLYKSLNRHIDADVVQDKIQDLYIWMYIHSDVTLSFYNRYGSLIKLMNLLIFNSRTTADCYNKLVGTNHMELFEDVAMYEEDDQHYINYALNPKLSTEERLEWHRVALEQTKEWLIDNPHSNTAKALERTQHLCKLRKGVDVSKQYYNVCLNYIATPSRTFLYNNADALGLIKSHNPVALFKKVCAEIWNKELVSNAIIHYSDIV